MIHDLKELSYVQAAKDVLMSEAQALIEVASKLDQSFDKAIDVILNHRGKIVITGMGKSGHVAQKIAATLSSTGTPSVYLHPAEAVHGDLGIYNPGDPTIIISKSGSTSEILCLIPTLRQFQSPIIAIVSNLNSPIALKADVVLDAGVLSEADPLGMVPTTSTLVSMAIGDALASVLMKIKGFKQSDFAKLHPAGQIGKNLLYNVSEVMHRVEAIAVVTEDSKVIDAIIKMTERPLGAACVVDDKGILKGIITDGDIRRTLMNNPNLLQSFVGEIMTKNPFYTEGNKLLADAVRTMEERALHSQLSVLPVIELPSKKLLGLIRLHDAYQL